MPTIEERHTLSSYISQDELKTLIAEGIKEFQASINLPVHGYQKPNFEKFDGLTGSPQEHLAHFYLVCGASTLSNALLIRQFV